MDTVRRISQEQPQVKIVALSTFSNRAFVAEAFRSGVHGFVLKQDGFGELLRAVQAVMSDSTYLCSRATEGILETCMEPVANPDRALEPSLTERECVVLQMLAEGRTSKEIALALDVSSKTVDACRRQLMRKLDVDSVAGLVKRAIVLGLTTLAS
jgi:DNA-binding NarL/FixJ family response regulator